MGRARSRPSGRTQSMANPTVFTSPADAVAKDRRGQTLRMGQQGRGTCSECGAEMNMRKATNKSPSRFGDIVDGSPVVPNHRPGGGQYSLRRNDVLCPGAGLRPKREA